MANLSIFSSSSNTNEQIFAERFLLRDQQFLRILLDHVPHPIFVKNEPDGRFVYWNNACEVLFGLKSAEVLGRTDLISLAQPRPANSAKKTKKISRAGKPS